MRDETVEDFRLDEFLEHVGRVRATAKPEIKTKMAKHVSDL